MGFIGDLMGFTGDSGMQWRAQGAPQYQVDDAWKNTQNALGWQSDFLHQLQGQNANTFASNQALQAQLGQMAAGGGPNPAQAQFQDNANKIAAQTAGMIGSQKGMSPALQARLMAQQGAGAQQGIAGQAAALQQQQQMAAIGALQNQNAAMLGQQQAAHSALNQGVLGQQGNVLGIQGSANAANAGVQGNVASQQGKMFGGLMQGAGMAFMAHGGEVPCYAEGGPVDPMAPQSQAASYFKHFEGAPAMPFNSGDSLQDGSANFSYGLINALKSGGGPGAMAGGAGDLPLIAGAPPVMAAARGGEIPFAGQVPGKANVPGDSLKNDTVSARLSPGEVVIPRSIMQSEDPAGHAAKFVAAVMAKHGRMPK